MVKKREGKRIDTGKKKENGAPIYNWIKNDNKTVDSELTNNINNDFINNDDITSLSDEEVSDYFRDNIEDLGDTYYTDSRTQKMKMILKLVVLVLVLKVYYLSLNKQTGKLLITVLLP